MLKNIKQIKVKKLLILLLLPILLLTFSKLKTNASYVPLLSGYYAPDFFYDVEMVYADDENLTVAKSYILISWQKYLSEDDNPVYINSYHTITGDFVTPDNYTTTYRSNDYVQQSPTFVKNQFIDWFGIENGTIYSQYFTILEIVGGHDIPPISQMDSMIYANRGGFISLDYINEPTKLATTDPTKEFERYIALELGGYTQGVIDTNIDLEVLRNQIRAQELARYTEDRNYYVQYIDELRLQLDTEMTDAFFEGYEEGLLDGAVLNEEEVYNEGYSEGLKDGGNNKFYENIEKWLVPAIIVVMFSGGVLLVFRKRSDD